jgi:hypothetical protein
LKDKIEWTAAGYAGPTVPKSQFLKDTVSSVVWLLEKQCGLIPRLYMSRDQDEIFCTLNCLEETLRMRADQREYKLQMRNPKEKDWETYKFMQVFPYVEFSESMSNLQLLKTYDESGEEAETGSLFNLIDKTRLVFGLISKALSLDHLIAFGILHDHYCVHHNLHLMQLKRDWATITKIAAAQPLDKIRSYFGERVSFYFAWIGFYLQVMMVAAGVGLLVYIFNSYIAPNISEGDGLLEGSAVFFSLFLCLWGTFFDQLWGRSECTWAWKWGTVNSLVREEQRGEYRGEFFQDPVTGKKRKKSEVGLFRVFKHAASMSIALLFVSLVVASLGGIFYYRYISTIAGDKFGVTLSGILNGLEIKVMNFIYYIVARKMNDWENHETESEYTEALSVKLFLFRFINCYISLFYIAFVKSQFEGCLNGDCYGELAYQLVFIFGINMSLNLLELGMPYVKDKINIWLEERAIQRQRDQNPSMRLSMAPTEREAKMAPYETPLEDYMEMVCQYGYVVMFSSVLTIVPVLALIEILVEIRVDAWKLCNLTRRPFPQRTDTIGVWYNIIQWVSFMGITTNVGLILFTSEMFALGTDKAWMDFLILEHVFVVLKLVISMVIPDQPTTVKHGLMWSDRKAQEQMFAKKEIASGEIKYEVLKFARESAGQFRLQKEDLCEQRTS